MLMPENYFEMHPKPKWIDGGAEGQVDGWLRDKASDVFIVESS